MGKLEKVDVCVVGSGAGGAVVACELAQAGVGVLLLERGRRFEAPRDYLATQPDWELRRSPIWQSTSAYPLTDGPLQRLDPRFKHLVPERGETVLPGSLAREAARSVRGPQALQMVFGVGGTTVLAAGQATRYGDETFRAGSIEGTGQDWPISYRELEPDYAAIEDALGVAGDPALPGPERQGPYPHPPHALSGASRVVARGCEKLGLHLYPQAVAAPTRPHRGRPACRACCASCMLGCPSGAKGSADVCFVGPALATGKLTLRTTACCLRLEPGPDGKVGRVVFADEAGSEQAVEARVVVLAAGAIETPRILLSSTCGRWPQGAANGSGQVGRNYQETLAAVSWGLSAEPIRSFTGLAVDNVVPDFARTPGHGRWARGFTVSVAAAGMNLLGPVAYALQLAPGWGERHAAFMREFFGRALVVQAAGEQLASPDNRVDLDPRAKDCRGRPKTRVVNRLGDNDLRMLAGMVSTIGDVLRASGATDIHHDNSSYISRMGVEPRGTCRMGLDPASSVVDKFGASHEIGNLFVADASVLVGGMHGNISLTIQALARRTARAIRSQLAG